MKRIAFFILMGGCLIFRSFGQNLDNSNSKEMKYDTTRIESHIKGLQLSILHSQPKTMTGNYPVLFIHGSSFPSELSFGFKMSGYSWMDYLADKNYESFALDFLGYGNSDRYPEMTKNVVSGDAVGKGSEADKDIEKAVDWILKKTGSNKIILIGHSWGGAVSALYASQHPEKIERLVLYAAVTVRNEKTESDPEKLVYQTMAPIARVNAMKGLTPPDQVCRLEPEIFKEWPEKWLASDPLAKANHQDLVRFPAGPDDDMTNLQNNIPLYDPSKITPPTLIIRGEWDDYPSNEDAGALLAHLTNAKSKKYIVIEKGTHVMHLEKSRLQLYEEVNNFISKTKNDNSAGHTIAVIFEVIPADGEKAAYLDIAAKLKPELEKINGFISIERFQSIYHPEKILSLSFWKDENAIREWRNLELHRNAQQKGREYIFKDYHLRIADVVRDYGMFDRKEAPVDSKIYHNDQDHQ